jgi:hypothetical protein
MPDRASPDTQTPELGFAGGYFNLLGAFYVEKCLSKKYQDTSCQKLYSGPKFLPILCFNDSQKKTAKRKAK